MSPFGANISENQDDVYDTILYLCNSPLFIWSANGPRILRTNDNAARFFRNYPSIENSTEVDLKKAMPDWRIVPNKKNNSTWMKFVDNEKSVKTLQVRNSCLDPEKNIWATVLIDNFSDRREMKTGSSFFFRQLEKLWSEMLESSSSFQNHLTELYSLVIGELGLTGFVFIPAESFDAFDLYPVLLGAVSEKSGWSRELVRKLLYEGPSGKQVFVRHENFEQSGNPVVTWAFDTREGEFAGFFCLEGLGSQNEADAQTVCDVLAEKFKVLFTTLQLRKENFITKFENEVNDIVNANIIEGVIITDDQFRIMYINPVAAMMFGFSSAQVVGHKLEDLLVTSEGIQKLVSSDASEDNVSSIKYLHRRSGKIFPCQIKALKMEAGYETYNIFVLSDQTETEENRLKNEQLTQKAFLGDFASMLAHEIRNPINNIQMWIANLYNLADGNEEFLSGAKRVDNDFQRITQLVNNILAFSKPIALNKEEIDLSLLISEIIEKWRLNFARKNITCYFTPQQDFPKIYGDPRSLEQVFNNLIGNSVDAFDGQDGIITLKLSLRESETGRKQVVITESDNGPGIPEDKIDSIFEPFMTTKKNGNGWGLALSKRIITSHKGTIQVKSFQGGTVFEILLPLNEENG